MGLVWLVLCKAIGPSCHGQGRTDCSVAPVLEAKSTLLPHCPNVHSFGWGVMNAEGAD